MPDTFWDEVSYWLYDQLEAECWQTPAQEQVPGGWAAPDEVTMRLRPKGE